MRFPRVAACLAAAGLLGAPLTTSSAGGGTKTVMVAPDGKGDFASLGEALAAAEPGTRIRLARGKYPGPFHLPGGVVVEGPRHGKDKPPEAILQSEDRTCVIVASGEVTLRNVLVRCPVKEDSAKAAVEVRGGSLTAESCVVAAAAGTGFLVEGKESRLVLRKGAVGQPRWIGIDVGKGGTASVEETDLLGGRTAAVRCRAARVSLRKCTLRGGEGTGVRVKETGVVDAKECEIADFSRTGVHADEGGEFRGVECRVHGNKEAGVAATGGSKAVLEECEVDRNGESGVFAGNGSKVTIQECRIHHSGKQGIYAEGGAEILAEETESYENGKSGAGAKQGGVVRLEGCSLHGNAQCGAWSVEEGALRMVQCRVVENKTYGIWVASDGFLTLERSKVTKNGRCAVYVDAEGTAEIVGNDLRKNPDGGITSVEGSIVTAGKNRE